LKATRSVRTVAKRLVLGVPAAAQGYVILAGRQGKFIAQVIHDADSALNDQWPILTAANNQRIGHRL
jgi:hypothetical protein